MLENNGLRISCLKIKLSKLASKDLQSTYDYISKDNQSAADSVIHRIIGSIENLAAFPGIGKQGRVSHTKELVIATTPLIIIYQIKSNTVYIVRIIHSSRKWP